MVILYFAFLRDYTGKKQEQWRAEPDLRALLHGLCEKYGQPLREKVFAPDESDLGEIIIMINGRHVAHLGGLDAPLRDDDTVQIFPVVAGG